MSDDSVLVVIYQYLQNLRNILDCPYDLDSLEVACQCIEGTGVDLNMNVPAIDLKAVVNDAFAAAGQKEHHQVPFGHDGKFPPQFVEYLSKLEKAGYFTGLVADSPEYMDRVKKAVEKWQSKYGGFEHPNSPRARSKSPVSVGDMKEAERLKGEGNAAISRGQNEEAVDFYGRAIDLNPTVAVYYANRSVAFDKLGRTEEAIQDCRQAIELDPSYLKAYCRLGNNLMKVGKYDEALSILTTAQQKDVQHEHKSSIDTLIQQVQKKMNANQSGGMDFGSLMSNPMFAQMAQQFAQNPDQLSSLLNSFGGAGAGASQNQGPGNPSPQPNPLEGIIPSEKLDELSKDPEIAELKNDPMMAEAMRDIEQNGMGAAMKYLGNPEMMAKLQKILANKF